MMNLIFILTILTSSLFAETLIAPADRYVLKDWQAYKSYPSFHPYLCEFSYRELADHVIDPMHREFDPSVVKPGDIIYVGVWYLDWFVSTVHDKIPHPYILITCDVGGWLPSPDHMKLIYDPKVVCWFGKNMLFTHHSKLHQLPMGQFYYLWSHGILPILDRLDHIAQNPKEKDILLYLNHTERPHGKRIFVSDLFYDKPYCFNRNRPKRSVGFTEYWDEISRSKFVLSPLGLEVDCTRTWECFILGAIPVLEHSYLNPVYDHLPILFIHHWNEINEEFLNQKYSEITAKRFDFSRAYIDYWANLIHEKQDAIRRGDVGMGALEANNFTEEDLRTCRKILSEHNMLSRSLIYQGNMTSLRPFQFSNFIPTIPTVYLNDLWTRQGYPLIKQYCKDPSLLSTRRVKIFGASQLHGLLIRDEKTLFLDLTHFRHKLFQELSCLGDFSHSLEEDIRYLYSKLHKGNLLIGNMSSDLYVAEVLERLETKHKIKFKKDGNFWFCTKN